MCGIWSWSGWCEGLLGGVREWVVCEIRSEWCAGVGVVGVRCCLVVFGIG